MQQQVDFLLGPAGFSPEEVGALPLPMFSAPCVMPWCAYPSLSTPASSLPLLVHVPVHYTYKGIYLACWALC